MKNAKVICANSLLKSFYGVLDEVKPFLSDFGTDNLVVVPDKFSMNAERMVFEYFKVESLFNVHVITLTRLVNKVLAGVLSREQILSKDSAKLLITKILLDNSKEFISIKNNASPQICEQFYNTLMQLKSSGISPEELSSKQDNMNLSLKLEDIKLVYEKYQEHVDGKLFDSADLIDIFNKEFAKNKYYTSCRIFVGMFDSFSYKQLSAITSLANHAKDFVVGLSANTKQANKYIYLNETLADVLQTFRENKVEYEVKNIYKKYVGDFETLSQNLFGIAHNSVPCQNNVMLLEAENIRDEVDFVARKIKSLADTNENFYQFNVACSSLEKYKPFIEEIFASYNLPYYADYSKNLSEHFLSKFLLNLFNIFTSGYSKDYVLEFLKSNFVKMPKESFFELENYLNKFGLDYSQLKGKFYDEQIEQIRAGYISQLFDIENKLTNCSLVSNYVDLIKSLLEQFDCKNVVEQIAIDKETSIEIKNASMQVIDKLYNVLDLINSMLGSQECSLEYFVKLFENVLSTTKINTVPLGVNKIFVGDATASSFYPNEILFIVGACDGQLPNYKNDCGMITDKEITMLNSKNLLNPTIRFVNKKAKYSLFELCLLPTKQLYISYPALSNGEASSPSEVFASIKNCLLTPNNESLPTYIISSELDYLNNKKFGLQVDKQSYQFVFGGKVNAMNLATKNPDNKICASLIKELVSDEENTNFQSFNADKLFFSKNSFSVSQVEKYFKCPYIHFVEYGLRLKEREKFGLENVDIGNFLHLVAEKYVRYLMDNNYEISFKVRDEIIDNILNNTLMMGDGKLEEVRVHSLKNEAVRLCENISKQLDITDFKPAEVEKSFTSTKTYEGLTVRGKIDRIDTWENFFVVYDYKTGKGDFSFDDVYYGNKIQILVYQQVLENLTGRQPVGAYYIPIKNKFLLENDSTKYSGVCLNSDDIIKKLDKTLLENSKSSIYKITYKKDQTLDSNSLNSCLTPNEYNALKNYVIKVACGALREIKGGNIAPKPTKNACEYCEYKLLCKFSQEDSGYREQKAKVSKNFFLPKDIKDEQ